VNVGCFVKCGNDDGEFHKVRAGLACELSE